MTSLAAAGVVVVVEADDFLLEADDFELASDGPGASDPRPIETYRDLWCIVVLTMSQHHCKGLTRSIQNNAKEQRLEQRLRKASKGFERLYWLYVKSIFVLLSQGWACATVNRERAAGLVFRSKLISEPEKLLSCRL